MLSQYDTIVLYGKVKRDTGRAVLFHVWIGQPQGVPREAVGQQLWFPKAVSVVFKNRQGKVCIEVPRGLLHVKLAELAKQAA